MSKFVNLVIIVEGQTEKIFVEAVLNPHLNQHSVHATPILISKSGQKGGDVRFDRLQSDLKTHLRQPQNSCVTTFIDFYALKGFWPGYEEAKRSPTAKQKFQQFTQSLREALSQKDDKTDYSRRFIPYVAMHEFEALLFSAPTTLAKHLDVDVQSVTKILGGYTSPEDINDSPDTAPSKRIEKLAKSFKKTVTGIAIAQETGLQVIRSQCPLFHEWVSKLERLSVDQVS